MSNYFKVSKVTDFNNLDLNDTIPEADFSLLTNKDKFIQFEFVNNEEKYKRDIEVKSGVWALAFENNTFTLKSSEFTKVSLIEDYTFTKDITSKVDTFFRKLDVYKELNIDAKRGILLYGPPGGGKSTAIAKVAELYANSPETAIIIWPSDKFQARNVKDFLNNLNYTKNNIQKLILIIEDLGGVEQNNGPRYSEASLLSILDNSERTFTIPTMIIATTNFPEMFLENLTNRPQRFDDVIEVKRPTSSARVQFLAFFGKDSITESDKEKIRHSRYDIFSPAHIKEIVVYSKLYDISIADSIDKVFTQADRAIKNFSSKKGVGIGFDYE